MAIKRLCYLALIRYILKDDTAVLCKISTFTLLCHLHNFVILFFAFDSRFFRKSCLLTKNPTPLSLFSCPLLPWLDPTSSLGLIFHPPNLHLYQFMRMIQSGWECSPDLSGTLSLSSEWTELAQQPQGLGPSTSSTVREWNSCLVKLAVAACHGLCGCPTHGTFPVSSQALPHPGGGHIIDIAHEMGKDVVVSLLGKYFKPCHLPLATVTVGGSAEIEPLWARVPIWRGPSWPRSDNAAFMRRNWFVFSATEILISFVTEAQPHPPCRSSHLQIAETSNIESVKMQNYLYSAHCCNHFFSIYKTCSTSSSGIFASAVLE